MQFPVDELALTILFVLCIFFNTFLFAKYNQSYSIKYELMRQHRFFRMNQVALYAVEIVYKAFFILPFVVLVVTTILQATKNSWDALPLFVSGLIVLLILYPIKREYYFIKQVGLWGLAFLSQLINLFLYGISGGTDLYTQFSNIFYTTSSMILGLAILSREGVYWQIKQAIQICKDKIHKINPQWVAEGSNLPKIFDGGIYGKLCKKTKYKAFLILYFTNVFLLGLNAFLVWLFSRSYLGIVGLLSNLVYDIFILTFSALGTQDRSIGNIFVLIFIGRLLSYIGGSQYWIFGYCALYFFIGIFIGRIIIERHLPMKFESNRQSRKNVNALKTPEFVIFLLTVEIILLIIAESYGVSPTNNVEYNGIQIQLWQFALIVIIVTWIIILYMASVRMMYRHSNKIRSFTEYYFGVEYIEEYHLYVFITYLVIIGLGVYVYLVLEDTVTFISALFVPLIYFVIDMILEEWRNNEFQIMADIDDYNVRARKKYNIRLKKQEVLKINIERTKAGKNKQQSKKYMNSLKMIQVQSSENHTQTNKQKPMEMTVMRLNEKISEQHSQSQDSFQPEKAYIQAEIEPFKELKNWRTENQYFSAKDYWDNFTLSDKKILIGIVLMTILLIGYAFCSSFISHSHFGLSAVFSFLCYLSLLPYYKLLKCVTTLSLRDILVSVAGLLLGLGYWIYNYHLNNYGLAWAAIYIVLCLFLVGLGIRAGMQDKPRYILLIFVGAAVAFICILLGFTVAPLIAIITSIFVFLVCIGMIPIYYLVKTDHIPLQAKLISGITITVTVIASAVTAFVLQIASNFAIFTFCALFIFLTLFVIASIIAIQKQANKYNHPHVYSAYGEPVYKFQSQIEKLKSSMNHIIVYEFSSVALIVYSALITLIFDEKYMAVYALSLYLALNFFQDLLYSMKSYYEIALQRADLNNQLIQNALNEVAEKYMTDEMEGKGSSEYEKELQQKKNGIQEISDPQLLDQEWKKIVLLHELYVKNLAEQEKFLFFWLVLIQFHLFSANKAKMVRTVNQVKQIEVELMQVGIFIESVNSTLGFQAKYIQVTKQIQALNPFDFIIYSEILEKHQKETLKQKIQADQHAKLQQKDNEEKQHQLFEKMKKQQEEDERQMKNTGGISSQITKFKEIVRSIGSKNFFTDSEFPANQNSLGEDLNKKVTAWRRPIAFKQVLCKGGFSAYDVKQGNIGDCYLISSLGVLGDKWISQAFGKKEEKTDEWLNEKGAYMVKFYKFLKEVYVIVDDFLPVNDQGEWVFAKSEDKTQVWPCILEKAYAKLYGGYDKIVEGKCSRVLAEFTGGFPFEILVQTYKTNPNGLWTKIITGKQNGYLLAAGSPSNPQGDSACSKRGIVQGHAYSVLDARQVEEYKLIKLKNPHGSGGREWLGDFSDQSELMTKRMMALLDHVQADDGIFWMTLEDFIYEYKSLYICAVFEQGWKKMESIQSAFSLQNSYGTPNLSDETYKNPQYGINVTKKCSIFVNLTQEAKTALVGINFIYMRVQRNQGKRIHKEDISSDRLCGTAKPPSNTVSISNEILLESSSYPYIFTLLLCTKDRGNIGKYTLQIYCNDEEASIIDDSKFDRDGEK